MNTGNGSRHLACKTCRDRKVRCDGLQPACQKCERAGEKCVYIMPFKQSKAELAESMEMLQERLGRRPHLLHLLAEFLLREIY